MSHILEMLMLVCFGLSWPISVYKTLKAHNANGKSCTFGLIIIFGYLCGILSKISLLLSSSLQQTTLFWITFSVYILNLIVVTIDVLVTAHFKYWKKK